MSDNLIDQFIHYAKIHSEVDYDVLASVKEGNKAVERLYNIAAQLKHENQLDQLINLLDNSLYKVDLWAAHILLERLEVKGELTKRALSVIKKYSKGDGIEAYGEELWLKDWKNRHP